MRILLINPNTSVEMTERIAAEAYRHADADTEIVAVTAGFGSEVIASRTSFAIAAHAALDTYANHASGIDAVLLACFGDPGLAALREISPVPVVGLLESALSEAARSDRCFATLTAGPVWVEMLDEMIRLSPFSMQNRGVFAIDATGLSISRDPDGFVGSLQLTLDHAISTGAEAVLLGGSALAGFGPRLAGGSVELIDPLRSAMSALQDPEGIAITHHPIAPPRLASRGLGLPLSRRLAGDQSATNLRRDRDQ